MKLEIVLYDDDGRQIERLSMDYELSDLHLSVAHEAGTPAESFIDRGSHYTRPGPQANAFEIRLKACASNLIREGEQDVGRCAGYAGYAEGLCADCVRLRDVTPCRGDGCENRICASCLEAGAWRCADCNLEQRDDVTPERVSDSVEE